MDRHVRILGVLNMVFGLLGAVIAIFILVRQGGTQGLYTSFNDDIVGMVAVILTIYQLVIAIPCFLAGLFVRKLLEPARVMLTVISAVNILDVPVGTILGAYGLWVLLTPETDPLFDHAREAAARPGQKRKAAARKKAVAAAKQRKKDDEEAIVPYTPE
jgi:hypothetical protein